MFNKRPPGATVSPAKAKTPVRKGNNLKSELMSTWKKIAGL